METVMIVSPINFPQLIYFFPIKFNLFREECCSYSDAQIKEKHLRRKRMALANLDTVFARDRNPGCAVMENSRTLRVLHTHYIRSVCPQEQSKCCFIFPVFVNLKQTNCVS